MDENIRIFVEEIGKRIEQSNTNLGERLERMHSDVRDVKKQAFLTNGRVTKLEIETENLEKLHYNCNAHSEVKRLKKEHDRIIDELHNIKNDIITLHLVRNVFRSKWAQWLLRIAIVLLLSGNFLYFLFEKII